MKKALPEMHVTSLSLMDIRSFKKTELKLSPSINLLVGNNNSGKSTIIKSLYKLQNQNSIYVDDVRKGNNHGRIFIDIGEISFKERAGFDKNHNEAGSQFPDSDKVKVVFGIYTDLDEKKRKQEALYCDLNNRPVIAADGIIRNKYGDKISLLDFKGFSNLETHNNFIYPFFAKRKTNQYQTQMGARETFQVSEDLRNITSKIQKLSNKTHPKYPQFMKCLDEILGFGIGIIPHGDNQSNTGIFVDNNNVIPIENMGEGVVNILGLIALLLTEDRKLYLIEELENDIHPKALKKLLELVIEKSVNNQFVISTHSNIVVKYLGVQNAKIFHSTWKPYEQEPDDQLPTSTISELENSPNAKLALLEDLGYDPFDFDLYKSYIIFEESSAEALVKDFLIPSFFPHLIFKIKTLAASGADDLQARFHDFLRLFVFVHQTPIYSSRAWVMADGDSAGITNIKKLQEKFPTWEPEHFINFSKKNIEEFYPSQFLEEFNTINALSDKRMKREAKAVLTKKVLVWAHENPTQAKQEFSESAAEILDHLRRISKQLE